LECENLSFVKNHVEILKKFFFIFFRTEIDGTKFRLVSGELTQSSGVNFNNILRAAFCTIVLWTAFSLYLPFDFIILWQNNTIKPLKNLDHLNLNDNELVALRAHAFAGLSKVNQSGVDFTNMFTCSFYLRWFQKRKSSVKSSLSFCTFGICAHKSCT